MIEQAILDRVAAGSKDLLDLLGELVAHDSGTYNKEAADALSRVLRARLEALDFAVESFAQEKFGAHLVGRRPSRNGRNLLLVGHFDTVWPAGTIERRPFRFEGGRAYGPGAFDMKGGIVVMLGALDALRAAGSPVFRDVGITVVLNADEEVLSPTSSPLIMAAARQSQTACVLEPAGPNGGYLIERKGAGKFYLHVRGRSAHAGRHPELGISANLEMAHKVVKLHALNGIEPGVTVNVGVMRGGERSNVICPEAYAEIDLRAFAMEHVERVVAEMRRIAADSTVDGTTAELSGDMSFKPVPRRRANEMLLSLVQEAARAAGFDAPEFISGGGSDGNQTAQVVPTLDLMGPRGDGAHTEDEYVIVDSLVERAQALAIFLHRWPDRIDGILAEAGLAPGSP